MLALWRIQASLTSNLGIAPLVRLRRIVAARSDRRARGTIVGRTQRQLPVEIHMS